MKTYQIAVIKGDGIGPEVCEATMEVLRRVLPDPRRLHFSEYPAGAEHYRKTGVAFPDETFKGCRRPGGSRPHRLRRRTLRPPCRLPQLRPRLRHHDHRVPVTPAGQAQAPTGSAPWSIRRNSL